MHVVVMRNAHPPCFLSMNFAQMEIRKNMPPIRPPKAPVYSAIHGRFLMFFCTCTLQQVSTHTQLIYTAELIHDTLAHIDLLNAGIAQVPS